MLCRGTVLLSTFNALKASISKTASMSSASNRVFEADDV
jgi:hypothetical protein